MVAPSQDFLDSRTEVSPLRSFQSGTMLPRSRLAIQLLRENRTSWNFKTGS
jgi:hypothetical protein